MDKAGAGETWTLMSRIVHDNDPRLELRRVLDLGRGSGRVHALLHLRKGPATMAELAAAMQCDPPYATIVVNELEARGLVVREADPADRRRRSVALTSSGRAAARKARAVVDRPPNVLKVLSDKELSTLTALLRRLDVADRKEHQVR